MEAADWDWFVFGARASKVGFQIAAAAFGNFSS